MGSGSTHYTVSRTTQDNAFISIATANVLNLTKIRSKGEPVNISRGMETLGAPHGFGAPPLGSTRLDQRAQSSGGDEEPMSDTEMSRDGDSPDALSRVPPTDVDPDTLEKLKQQEREEREEIEKELRAQRE